MLTQFPGWGGETVVRIDLVDAHGRALHLYVEPAQPLAKVKAGARLRLVSDA